MFTDHDPSVSLHPGKNGNGTRPVTRYESKGLDWHNPCLMHFFEQFPARIIFQAGRSLTFSDLKWSEARRIALSRDGYRCRICGEHERSTLTVHHIHPKRLGGW
jgi:hypothetical protein